MEKTDSELVALARSGNKEAFGQLIDRHQARAMRVARGMVRNEDVAQELVQEAMLQAYLSLGHLREGARFPSWHHGIVLNVCRHYLRDREPDCLSWEAMAREPDVETAEFSDPGLVAEQREQERLVLDAVHALSPQNRDATLLFYYEQLSLQETAAALGISVGAVKSRLHQSRKQLRERLLSLYPERIAVMPKSEQKRKMVKVSVLLVSHGADPKNDPDPSTSESAARQFLLRIIMSQSSGHTRDWVGLMEEGGDRFLPIQLGWDVRGIAAVLNKNAPDVSPPLALMARLLEATHSNLEEVRIEPLKDEILHGVLRIRQQGAEREIAARPGDAVALAVQTVRPIYAAEEIMARASWDLSNSLAVVERLLQANDEASLQRAVNEPLIVRVVQGMIEYGLRYLSEHTFGDMRLERSHKHGRHWIFLNYRSGGGYDAGGSSGGANVALPEAALPVVIARFKHMANLSLAERHALQHGHTTVQDKGKEYDVGVTTEPTELGEKLILRFQQKESAEGGAGSMTE